MQQSWGLESGISPAHDQLLVPRWVAARDDKCRRLLEKYHFVIENAMWINKVYSIKESLKYKNFKEYLNTGFLNIYHFQKKLRTCIDWFQPFAED